MTSSLSSSLALQRFDSIHSVLYINIHHGLARRTEVFGLVLIPDPHHGHQHNTLHPTTLHYTTTLHKNNTTSTHSRHNKRRNTNNQKIQRSKAFPRRSSTFSYLMFHDSFSEKGRNRDKGKKREKRTFGNLRMECKTGWYDSSISRPGD